QSPSVDGIFFPIARQELDVDRTFSAAGFTVSENGVIVFQSTLDSPTHLAWFDRSGNEVRSLSSQDAIQILTAVALKTARAFRRKRTGLLLLLRNPQLRWNRCHQ